ncbi:MAG TPA: TonB-dependent receptor [Balneolaceae bacterium]|nr:TonB-dependent receptor [Balneolaceae bacterium]
MSGKVSDAQSGNSLPGVNIKVKGTTTGTSTNSKGHYSLNVPSKQDTLIFSYIGYKQQAIPINGRSTINVKMQSSTISGKQMVVVGYGKQQEQNLTGSEGTVQMQSLSSQPITGANQALAGQIAGVQVNTTNGIPGGGPQIQIRGVGSIGAGNSPLYVVDGMPLPANSSQTSNPLNNIPASDIASISVLKGPSAKAIYGSRASNGVVLITTKQGKNGTFNFHVDAYNGWQVIPNNQRPNMMNARQFATWQKQRIEAQNKAEGTNNPVPEAYQNPSQYGKGTDWFNALTRVAPQRKFDISASGGTKKISSYMSAGYLQQGGVVVGTDYNRFNVRANVTAKVSPKLTVRMQLSPTYSYGSRSAQGGVIRFSDFGHWEVLNPIQPVYNSDGSYNKYICGPLMLCYPNPVMDLKIQTNRQHEAHVIGNGIVKYNLTNYLRLKSTIGIDYDNTNQSYFRPSQIGSRGHRPPSIPSGNEHQYRYMNWDNENSITFNHTFAGGNHVKLLGDFSEQRQANHNITINGTQFPDNSIRTLNAAGKITGDTYGTSWTVVSYLGRLNYSYKDRYLLTASIRRDGSSRFGPNNRWGTFPSGAIAWRVSSEPWMQSISHLINNLKIRASYGITGNDQIGNFSYTSNIGSNNYVLGGSSLASGRTVNSLSNYDLGWEKTKEIDLGLNMGFLNNRVTLNADVYRSRTSNLLLSLEIPQSSGFSNTTKNIGEVQNKGLELDVHTLDISKDNFKWKTNFNFSLNRNKTLALGPKGKPILAGASGYTPYSNITEVGKPVGMLYGFKFLGLYTKQQLNNPDIPKYDGAIPGDMRVLDGNGNGKIDAPGDKVILANPYPKFNYGITSTFNYKNISLHLVLQGSYGATKYKYYYESVHNIDGVFNVPAALLKHGYKSPQNPGNGRIPNTAGPELNHLLYRDISSLSLFNASYLWVKNIMVGYTLPQSITKGFLKNAKIYGNIQNAFIITPYPNGNPATSNYRNFSGSSTLTPGYDTNPYPTPRVYTIGIKLNL